MALTRVVRCTCESRRTARARFPATASPTPAAARATNAGSISTGFSRMRCLTNDSLMRTAVAKALSVFDSLDLRRGGARVVTEGSRLEMHVACNELTVSVEHLRADNLPVVLLLGGSTSR